MNVQWLIMQTSLGGRMKLCILSVSLSACPSHVFDLLEINEP